MNGMGAIREIRKRAPQTKIVVLTVHKTKEYISRQEPMVTN
jgi:DNA-binding NarL/FixJ family response regulator